LSQARGRLAAAAAGNKNIWTTAQLSQGRRRLAAASAGNKILFAGYSCVALFAF